MQIDISYPNKESIITSPLEISECNSINNESIDVLESELGGVIFGYNFDTFSFVIELLEFAQMHDLSLSTAYDQFEIDTLSLLEKYKGTNCAGLSMKLQKNLMENGMFTYLIPAYGNYLATPEADDFVQVRTVDLIAVAQVRSELSWIFLAPGLSISKPIIVEDGSSVNQWGRQYIVSDVKEDSFNLTAVRTGKEDRGRNFHFEQFHNPDRSSQKNLLRCRTRYQLVRRYPNEHKDVITYDFLQDSFLIELGGHDKVLLKAEEMLSYTEGNNDILEERFRSSHIAPGLKLFISRRREFGGEIFIPELRQLIFEQ